MRRKRHSSRVEASQLSTFCVCAEDDEASDNGKKIKAGKTTIASRMAKAALEQRQQLSDLL